MVISRIKTRFKKTDALHDKKHHLIHFGSQSHQCTATNPFNCNYTHAYIICSVLVQNQNNSVTVLTSYAMYILYRN
jgi:hypothetical protein